MSITTAGPHAALVATLFSMCKEAGLRCNVTIGQRWEGANHDPLPHDDGPNVIEIFIVGDPSGPNHLLRHSMSFTRNEGGFWTIEDVDWDLPEVSLCGAVDFTIDYEWAELPNIFREAIKSLPAAAKTE